MYTFWTKNLTQEEKSEFKYKISSGAPALKVLLEEVKKERSKIQLERRNKEDYNVANWHLLQADLIGEERATDKVVKLIENLIDGK